LSAIAAYVVDLMDRSKISSSAAAAGDDVTFVRSAQQLAERAAAGGVDVAVVDLSRVDALDAITTCVSAAVTVVAFGSHVDTDRLEAARDAGAGSVLARSAFFADPAGSMRG
jgi:hypothetical protein